MAIATCSLAAGDDRDGANPLAALRVSLSFPQAAEAEGRAVPHGDGEELFCPMPWTARTQKKSICTMQRRLA